MKQYIIGFKRVENDPKGDYKVTTHQETREQIQHLMENYTLNLYDREENRPCRWEDFVDLNDYKDLRLLNAILGDREKREKGPMWNRPQFAVITVEGDEIIRLEFYDYGDGGDGHELTYDFRRADLYDRLMKPWMEC